jgi:thiol-disulfide isomerase/thioredoxin
MVSRRLSALVLGLGLLLVIGGCEEPLVRAPSESPSAPELSRPGLDAERIRLADYRGRVVLLNFWATWCPYCKKEIPHLIAMQEDLGDEGLQVVGAALNWEFNSQKPGEPAIFRDKVGGFVLEKGVSYPVPLVTEGMSGILERFGNPVGTIPYTVLIDREGRIRATFQGNPGEATLRRAVKRLL